MGPGRGGDGGADLPVEAAAERVDLGERSRPQERPADAQHDVAAASSRAGGHWLAGLVRADVLGVTGVAVVVLSVIGVPFLSAIQQMTFFRTPVELSSAWAFLPFVTAGGVAVLLGLGGLRQAGRHGAAGWVRTVAGVAVLLGLVMATGSAVTWLYAVDAGLFDPMPQL